MGEVIRFVPITGPDLGAALPTVLALLKEFPDTWEDYYSDMGIAQRLVEGDFQLWLGTKGGATALAVLSSVVEYEKQRVAYVDWIAGEDIHAFLPYLTFIEEWARTQQCNRLEMRGRKGWVKLLAPQGYRQTHVVVGKDLEKKRRAN